jgi:hypothetical protein
VGGKRKKQVLSYIEFVESDRGELWFPATGIILTCLFLPRCFHVLIFPILRPRFVSGNLLLAAFPVSSTASPAYPVVLDRPRLLVIHKKWSCRCNTSSREDHNKTCK